MEEIAGFYLLSCFKLAKRRKDKAIQRLSHAVTSQTRYYSIYFKQILKSWHIRVIQFFSTSFLTCQTHAADMVYLQRLFQTNQINSGLTCVYLSKESGLMI